MLSYRRKRKILRQFVDNFAPTSESSTVLKESLATKRYLLARSLILLLFLGVLGGSAKADVDFPHLAAASAGPGLQFVIADLDGDLRPDFASIQSGPDNSSGTDYWIQLQLAAGRQSIRLVAPAGGLVIEGRTAQRTLAAWLLGTNR